MTLVELLMISWALFSNECLISLIWKKKQDPEYIAGSDTSADDIKEDIGPVLYRLGQATYKLSFLYVFWRMNNYTITPQLGMLALYLFTVVNNLIIKNVQWWFIFIIMFIFNVRCPLSSFFLSLLS